MANRNVSFLCYKERCKMYKNRFNTLKAVINVINKIIKETFKLSTI